MHPRDLTRVSPALLPIAATTVVMFIAIGALKLFSETPANGCCGSSQIAFPKDGAMQLSGSLPPELYGRRIHYVAALEFQVVAILGAIALGTVILLPLLRRGSVGWRLLFVSVVLAMGTTAAMTIIDRDVSPALRGLLDLTVTQEYRQIDAVRLPIERATSIAATYLIAIAGLLLLPVSGSLEKRLRETAEHHSRLSQLLALGTVLLAGNTLMKLCLGQWASAYYEKGDSIQMLVRGIVSSWAVYDSLILATAFIPAAVVLRLRLRADASEIDQKSPPPWFDRAWTTLTPLHDLPRILAILTPFLVGQAPDVVALLR